ncbi:hypothetical protein DU19_0967 [Chlamydia muridarum]|nr:hypothetical protein TAC_04635 [Chlamydia muridarum str. Nigg3 CMUT3-5]AHH24188.1 hypothetical protein Y015_04635 [Chlamydia muridarum str. Nigg CM972]KDU80858.1 hypothetical protein DU17_0969 [Chlamydia muridarum]KDU81907.1 hypothetical protein DU18_0967 [Chlamydia muridarum]KDU82859.1 hypothetical protein DU19_0967 [Chlamydia muridarum]
MVNESGSLVLFVSSDKNLTVLNKEKPGGDLLQEKDHSEGLNSVVSFSF